VWDRNRNLHEPATVVVNLGDLRAKLGIPTKDFAQSIGVTTAHLRFMEAGKRGVSDEMAEKIQAAIYGYFSGKR
jgi:plasmid maintenance system antidote protein VapI